MSDIPPEQEELRQRYADLSQRTQALGQRLDEQNKGGVKPLRLLALIGVPALVGVVAWLVTESVPLTAAAVVVSLILFAFVAARFAPRPVGPPGKGYIE